MKIPDSNTIFPLENYKNLCFLKNYVKNPNIRIGEYTSDDDFEDEFNIEKNVKYHFDFIGDKLIIGKFCMIASGVQFVMNGGNHLTEAITVYPLAIFGDAWQDAMKNKKYPTEGNTIIGNDVWLGFDATIMPGVKIGDVAIIASKSVFTNNVEPYTIVGGKPAKIIRKIFSDEKINAFFNLK